MAEAAQFPDCCGLIVLNKFKGGHPGANPDDCMSEADCNVFLSSSEKKYYNERTGLLVVLSQPQFERLGHLFVKRKWELLFSKNNPRTQTKIYMYFRDLNHTEARQKRIFGSDR